MWNNTMISALGFLIISLVASVALSQEAEEDKSFSYKSESPYGTETEQKPGNVKVPMSYAYDVLNELRKTQENTFPSKRSDDVKGIYDSQVNYRPQVNTFPSKRSDDVKGIYDTQVNYGQPVNTFPSKRFELGSTKAYFMQAGSELDREINETAKKLRQAKSDDERAQASQALIQLLSKDYDERLETYEASLKALEDKMDKMQTNLQKRRDAKSDMIQLRLRLLLAEADGLGWPKRMGPSGSFGQERIGAYFLPQASKAPPVPPTAPTPRGNND